MNAEGCYDICVSGMNLVECSQYRSDAILKLLSIHAAIIYAFQWY